MRSEKIDLLRFIGLAMIVLAHIDPPFFIFQLRNFDVPLMLLVSGISFGLAYKQENYFSYVWKRIKRLVFPVWIFLSFYFSLMLVTGHPVLLPNAETIYNSYLLLSGIGYVWIIRVFLLVALIAPLIWKLHSKTFSTPKYFSILIGIYILYEFMFVQITPYLNSLLGKIFAEQVLQIIPYAFLFALGLRLPSLTNKQVISLCCFALIMFIIIALYLNHGAGKFIPTQEFKYPPRIYYLSYALFVSILLWLSSDKILVKIKKLRLIKPLLFIAQNSIWIYLWHILFLSIFHTPFYIKYFLVFGSASWLVFMQVYFVRQLVMPRLKNASFRKNINLLFTG